MYKTLIHSKKNNAQRLIQRRCSHYVGQYLRTLKNAHLSKTIDSNRCSTALVYEVIPYYSPTPPHSAGPTRLPHVYSGVSSRAAPLGDMNNAAAAARARRGRAPGAPRRSGASRGSASRVRVPGGGGAPHTSGTAVPRSRRRNKSARCPPPTEGCGQALAQRRRPGAPPAAARAPLPSAPPPHLGLRSLRRAERRGGTSPRGRVLGARRSPLRAGRCVPPRRPLAAGQRRCGAAPRCSPGMRRGARRAL